MKKMKGFTLIELLAVIVILAVIALIATPIVMQSINDAKEGAAISSAYGYITSLENTLGKEMILDTTLNLTEGTVVITTSGNSSVVQLSAGGKTKILDVKTKGAAPTAINLTIKNGVVTGGTLTINGSDLTVHTNGSVSKSA